MSHLKEADVDKYAEKLKNIMIKTGKESEKCEEQKEELFDTFEAKIMKRVEKAKLEAAAAAEAITSPKNDLNALADSFTIRVQSIDSKNDTAKDQDEF